MAILSGISHILNTVRRSTGQPLLKAPQADWLPWPYIDSLFDFTKILGAPIAKFPDTSKRVAIIGAGAAGMCAAYELLRAGLVPVVFEASDRIGGRAWSQGFVGSNAFAELGSMRVPPSQKTFCAYAAQFGMTAAAGGFPDPGKVQTRLYYQNKPYDWAPNTVPPGPFARLAHDFNNWITPMADALHRPMQAGDLRAAAQIWQSFINKYRDVSFYQALVAGIPTWTSDDLNAFGALGVGSGGFGPLYEVGMLEMLRIILLGWEDNQQLYIQGMSALPLGFYNADVGGRSLASVHAVRLNSPVTALAYDDTHRKPLVTVKGHAPEAFDAVIVATTTRAMSVLGLSLSPQNGTRSILSQDAKVGIRDLHMTASSKVFIRTATKFWQNKGPTFPSNIQTDELPRGVYALDYGPSTPNGVVLISYTWEDDSMRTQALSLNDRFGLMTQAIGRAAPEWSEFLTPLGGQILTVDWQSESNYYGAFKLNYPGTETACQASYFQFKSCINPDDTGVYMAGDGVSWSGGWTEGAVQTALNAVTAVAVRFGGVLPGYNAMMQSEDLYDYQTGIGHVKMPEHLL